MQAPLVFELLEDMKQHSIEMSAATYAAAIQALRSKKQWLFALGKTAVVDDHC